MTVYVGTYSPGVYSFRFEPSTGKTSEPSRAAESSNPSFLVLHPNKRFLYAANENPEGTVSAFSIGDRLALLNSVSSRGADPCHVAIDQTGRWLLAANYNGGSVAVFPIGSDGTLAEAVTVVQHSGSSSHPHQVVVSADNKLVLVPDLGTDQVVIYRLDAGTGALAAPSFVKVAPGAGPRHLVFGSDGQFVYVLNELAATITVLNEALEQQQTLSTLPADFEGTKGGAEIVIHPNGKILYASNRGHDSIAIFHADKGTLLLMGHVSTQGKTPRNFAIDPTGAYLLAANQDSGTIVIFRIDPNTGGLTPSGNVVRIPSPVSIVFV